MNGTTFAVPGSLDTPTGGYLYDRRIVDGLRSRGWSVRVLDLGEGFPLPDTDARKNAEALLLNDNASTPIVVDGLALGALPEIASAIALNRPLVGLVHHPLYLEKGHSDRDRERLFKSEQAALAHACRIVTTSRETRDRICQVFAVPEGRVDVVEPGMERPAAQAPFRDQGPLRLLSVGTLIPRKGHDFLVRALADLSDLPWSLRIIGDPSRDVTFADRLTALISDLGLQDRISLDGVVSDEDLRAAYLQSDIFALASEHEGYGMAFAEAVLSGLPVIGTTGGAISDTVPSDAGILVPPGDMEALKAALREIMTDTDRRRTLVDGAHRSASAFATWDGAADRFAAILETVL